MLRSTRLCSDPARPIGVTRIANNLSNRGTRVRPDPYPCAPALDSLQHGTTNGILTCTAWLSKFVARPSLYFRTGAGLCGCNTQDTIDGSAEWAPFRAFVLSWNISQHSQ